MARTREEQPPSTPDRARAANRERSADALTSLVPFQQRTQQLGEALQRPRCLFADEDNQGDAGGERDSGEGLCERGDVSGLRQRRERGEVRGDDVDGEGNGRERSGAERAALRDGVDPRLRGLLALFPIGKPHVS